MWNLWQFIVFSWYKAYEVLIVWSEPILIGNDYNTFSHFSNNDFFDFQYVYILSNAFSHFRNN